MQNVEEDVNARVRSLSRLLPHSAFCIHPSAFLIAFPMPTLADIASLLGTALPAGADAARNVVGVASLAEAGESHVSFVSSDAYAKDLPESRAGVVIAGRKVRLPQSPAKMPV